MARYGRQGWARQGQVGIVSAWQAPHGLVGHGRARHEMEWQSRIGPSWGGKALLGVAGRAGRGLFRVGSGGFGMAWQETNKGDR